MKCFMWKSCGASRVALRWRVGLESFLTADSALRVELDGAFVRTVK